MQTILLADDNQSIRAGLRKILAEHVTFAHRVLEAENGQKAMELMRREPVDILVADIKMPLMDGIQLLAQLKQECRPCEVIMLSGYDDYSLIRSALKLNAFDYLLKPVNIPIFVQVVNHARQKLSERKNIPPATPGEPGGQAAAAEQALISIEFFDVMRTDLDPSRAEKYLDEAMAHTIALKPGKAADCFERFFGCLGPGTHTPEAVRSKLTQWVYDLMKKSNGFIEIIGTSKLTADDVMNCIKSLPTLSQLRVRFPEIILSYISRLSAKPETRKRCSYGGPRASLKKTTPGTFPWKAYQKACTCTPIISAPSSRRKRASRFGNTG